MRLKIAGALASNAVIASTFEGRFDIEFKVFPDSASTQDVLQAITLDKTATDIGTSSRTFSSAAWPITVTAQVANTGDTLVIEDGECEYATL